MKALNSYQQFLVESKNDFDIATEFDKYNRLIFNNTLTRDFPCIFKKDKHLMGFVQVKYVNLKMYVNKLVLTSFYKLSHEQYVNLLVHEMIHVELAQNQVDEKDSHGPKFIKRMDQINKDFNLNITKLGDRTNLTTNTKKKLIQFVIMNGVGLMVYKKPMSESDRIEFMEDIQYTADFRQKDIKLEFGESDSVELSRFIIARTSKTAVNRVYNFNGIVKRSISNVPLKEVIVKYKKK